MKSWVIVSKDTNKMVPGTKIYPTKRGSTMGFNAFLDTQLQQIYLQDEMDYSFYVHMTFRKSRSGFNPGHSSPIGSAEYNKQVEEYERLRDELLEKYEVREGNVEIQ